MPAEFSITGLDQFVQDLNQVIQKYPYESEELLKKMGNKFKSEVKKDTPVGKSKKKKLINSYHLSKVQGYGTNLSIDFYSNAPHFHLIERGHKIVTKARIYTGRSTQAKGMVRDNVEKFQNGEYPEEVERMVKRMIGRLET